MKFRFIRVKEFDAHTNMALDEAICEAVDKKESLPTIRLYRWNPSAVSVGYFQGLNNEIDLKVCAKKKVDYVRRRTGGGAVYHDYDGEITYSIIAPVNKFDKSIVKSYEQICNYLIKALGDLGIEAKFSPINDIIVGDKKISGNAQTRRGKILLQHGTILYKVDVDKMFSLLKVGKEKIADKLIKSVKKRVTSIHKEDKNISIDEVAKAIENAFASSNQLEIGKYTTKEMKRAKELVKEKYSTDEWNHMR